MRCALSSLTVPTLCGIVAAGGVCFNVSCVLTGMVPSAQTYKKYQRVDVVDLICSV